MFCCGCIFAESISIYWITKSGAFFPVWFVVATSHFNRQRSFVWHHATETHSFPWIWFAQSFRDPLFKQYFSRAILFHHLNHCCNELNVNNAHAYGSHTRQSQTDIFIHSTLLALCFFHFSIRSILTVIKFLQLLMKCTSTLSAFSLYSS